MSLLPKSLKSAEIAVRTYRQILIWPLLLKPANSPLAGKQFDAYLDMLTRKKEEGYARWIKQNPAVPSQVATDDAGLSPGDEANYEEMVYFHSFVRDFLYGDGSPDEERALIRLRRHDVKRISITLADSDGNPAGEYCFDVPRVELYLCKPLVALLVFEISWPPDEKVSQNEMTLDIALKVQSQFRQAFPPYFKGAKIAGNCPLQVAFFGVDPSKPLVTSDFTSGRRHFAEKVHRGAELPVAAHWHWLMQPLLPFASAAELNPNCADGYYQQIVDDRIPGMTYLAVDDPRSISDGDFDRLTFCDLADEASFPFSEQFLKRNREKYAYERFWRRKRDHDTSTYQLDTRYLCSGYQFVVVGRKANDFFTGHVLHHFRRHYFRMGLIVHFHRAALLKFADEIADAIKTVKNVSWDREFGDREFRARITYLQMTFLKFRSRCWFSEVSNQLQGGELFAWWSQLLGNEDLFKKVDESAQRLYTGLAEYESRQLARAAFIGLPLSISVGVFGLLLSSVLAMSEATLGIKLAAALIAIFLAVGCAHAFLRFMTGKGLWSLIQEVCSRDHHWPDEKDM
jgi:hypothetical protein